MAYGLRLQITVNVGLPWMQLVVFSKNIMPTPEAVSFRPGITVL